MDGEGIPCREYTMRESLEQGVYGTVDCVFLQNTGITSEIKEKSLERWVGDTTETE